MSQKKKQRTQEQKEFRGFRMIAIEESRKYLPTHAHDTIWGILGNDIAGIVWQYATPRRQVLCDIREYVTSYDADHLDGLRPYFHAIQFGKLISRLERHPETGWRVVVYRTTDKGLQAWGQRSNLHETIRDHTIMYNHALSRVNNMSEVDRMRGRTTLLSEMTYVRSKIELLCEHINGPVPDLTERALRPLVVDD